VILESFLAAQKQGQPIRDVIDLPARNQFSTGEAAMISVEDEP